jgi:hypothetical protein
MLGNDVMTAASLFDVIDVVQIKQKKFQPNSIQHIPKNKFCGDISLLLFKCTYF